MTFPWNKFISNPDKHASSAAIIEQMLTNAAICLEQDKPERAFETYAEIVKLTLNTSAQYNLGVLYATGQGTGQDLLQAAYWFHQAAVNGDEQAGKLEHKSLMDLVHKDFDQKSPQIIYHELLQYGELVYPRESSKDIAVKNLNTLAKYHWNKQQYAEAAKLYRASAQYGDDGEGQNFLAVLYNHGAGVEQNDLAALYWFDRAVDNHFAPAKTDRDGILNAYRGSLSPSEFYEQMELLAEWCTHGSADVPQDGKKAAHWRSQCKQ